MVKEKELRLLNINARSVINKVDSLEVQLMQHDPHITVITETWLRSEIGDDEVFPVHYNVFRKDRTTRGGGVAVLVKPPTEAVILADIGNLECLCLQITCWDHSFILYACYRPPDAAPDYLATLQEHMSLFLNKKIFLIGDFNLPSIDWVRLQTCNQATKNENTVLNIMLAHDLIQLVKQPTRVQGQSSSVLDLVFVNRDFSEHTVLVEQGLSDHSLVSISIPLVKSFYYRKPYVQTVKDYSRANDARVIEHMEAAFVDFNDGVNDACTLWDRFLKVCRYCINNFIPNKRKKTNKRTPWMTRSIIHLKRKIKRLKKRHAPRSVIRELQSSLANEVQQSKDYYFKTVMPNFLRDDPSKFWNYLSESKKPVTSISVNGKTITNCSDIADHFNNYFQSVFTNSAICVPGSFLFEPCEANFISYSGLVSMLLNLKTKKCCGPDDLPSVFLRRYAECIAKFLLLIFQASLLTATLPRDWRIARVIPIFKKGDRLIPDNYRPISLTSACCKLIEHIIANRITEFLERNSILTTFQHGFRKGYSTMTQLVTVTHEFAKALDNNVQIDTIFLDLSKAFDKVPHDKLIEKLKNINLPEILVAWVSRYLMDREQYVFIDGHGSSYLPVTSGVPQGSVLGPLLFLLYINDIVTVVTPTTHIRLFADDCIIFREISSMQDQIELNTNLDKIYSWCKEWGMVVNAEKTVSLRITRKKSPFEFEYTLGSGVVNQVNSFKYLGVTFTSNLSWNLHVDNICSSAFRKLCFLRHKLRNSPPSVKLLCYYSYIRPKLEYAAVVWDPYTKNNIDKLERIQRKAVRFIFSKFRRTDSPSEIMSTNNIPKLQLRRQKLRLDFLCSLANHELAIDPSLYISALSTRRTRHHHPRSLTPYHAKTDTYKFSFFPRTVSEWNSLTDPYT